MTWILIETSPNSYMIPKLIFVAFGDPDLIAIAYGKMRP